MDAFAGIGSRLVGRRRPVTYSASRRAYLALIFIAFPFGNALIMWAAFAWADWLAALLIAWTIGISVISNKIACPECRRPIGLGRTRIFGIEFEWWKVIPASTCEYKRGSTLLASA